MTLPGVSVCAVLVPTYPLHAKHALFLSTHARGVITLGRGAGRRIYTDVKEPVILKDGSKQVVIKADSKWKVSYCCSSALPLPTPTRVRVLERVSRLHASNLTPQEPWAFYV